MTISVDKITQTVARLYKEANYFLPEDIWRDVEKAFHNEKSEIGKNILSQILENASLAGKKEIPLCQDTGIAEVFLEIGQDARVVGGDLYDAINKGIALAYKNGFLRASVVDDPLNRENTKDNTPAQIYTDIVPGDKLKITVLPKGAGSENASTLKMFSPSDGWQAIKDFVFNSVKEKGINACPPLIVGIGIGGSFSSVTRLAKKALIRDIETKNKNSFYSQKEKELLDEINSLGIGPMGLGGEITALAVNIETAPCHIASLPVAINMQCHCCRRKTEVL